MAGSRPLEYLLRYGSKVGVLEYFSFVSGNWKFLRKGTINSYVEDYCPKRQTPVYNPLTEGEVSAYIKKRKMLEELSS